MAKSCRLTVRVTYAWWVEYYQILLFGLAFCWGCEPDPDQVWRVLKKGIKFQVEVAHD